MLALDRALRQGLDLQYLFNIYEGVSGRVRFHGVRSTLIAQQARSIGIPLLQDATHPDDYETVFLRMLDRLQAEGIGGVIFGNIHLADIRAWYEERVTGRGLEHLEPLWGEVGDVLLREVVTRGFQARLVSVDLACTPSQWLGRTIDQEFIAEILSRPDLDPCGERGEYHTFVHDGPIFREPLRIQVGDQVETEGHALLEVLPAPSLT
jgi:uncharacterized protein (TIGR00290 family)